MSRPALYRLSLLAGMLFSLSASAEMPRMELSVGFHRIEAEVAANQENRALGGLKGFVSVCRGRPLAIFQNGA